MHRRKRPKKRKIRKFFYATLNSQKKCPKHIDKFRNRFPDGRVFAGVGTVTGVQVQSNLEKLGSLNGTVLDTAIKKTIQIDNAVVYIFTNDATFQSTFKAAGLSLTNISLGNANGATFPIGTVPVWYSAMNESTGNNQTGGHADAAKVTYTTTHELGHTVDMNMGQPSQVPTGQDQKNFDLAMQNDWLVIDYTDAAGTQKRLPCSLNGYTGPFVGSIDPSEQTPTGGPVQICVGGSLNSAQNKDGSSELSKYSQLKNHEIFQGLVPELIISEGGPIGNNPGATVKFGWFEWFAQAFAVVGRSDTGSTSNRPMVDQALTNGAALGGYFGCTAGNGKNGQYNGWLNQVYTSGSNPGIAKMPQACQKLLPAGWNEV